MRPTIFLLLLTLFVFSAAASSSTDSSNSTTQACSDCWTTQRDQISACKNIPATELADFDTMTDESLAANATDYPTLVNCLCALSSNVNKIITSCPACSTIAQGLTSEASIVSAGVCAGNQTTATSNNSQNGSDASNSSSQSNGSTDSNASTPQDNSGNSADGDVNAQSSHAASIAPSIFTWMALSFAAWLYAF